MWIVIGQFLESNVAAREELLQSLNHVVVIGRDEHGLCFVGFDSAAQMFDNHFFRGLTHFLGQRALFTVVADALSCRKQGWRRIHKFASSFLEKKGLIEIN